MILDWMLSPTNEISRRAQASGPSVLLLHSIQVDVRMTGSAERSGHPASRSLRTRSVVSRHECINIVS